MVGRGVTIVHRGEEIHKNVKYWLKPNIKNHIQNGDIPMHWRSQVLGDPSRFGLTREAPDGLKEIKNSGLRDDRLSAGHRFPGRPRHWLRSGDKRPHTDPQGVRSDPEGVYLAA